MILSEDAVRFAARYAAITRNPKYLKLQAIPRHGCTNTYDHSVRVAKMAHDLAPLIGVDADSAARVGLLHDFCMVDYHQDDKDSGHDGRWYCFYHPEDAIQNSLQQGFTLTRQEQRAIHYHMFPLAVGIPNSRLGYLLTYCDKNVALRESFCSAQESWVRFGLFLNRSSLKAVKVIKHNTYDRFF